MPTSGPFSKLVLAAGARLNPISATMAPVITGGSVTSIQCVPTSWTVRPMSDQQRADGHQPAERAARTMRGHRRRHRRDHREARPQVARQPVAGDHQEQQRADAGEQQRGGGRETGQHRHQERGAEHRHHVLGPDAERAWPAQPLVGADHEVLVGMGVDARPGQRDHGLQLHTIAAWRARRSEQLSEREMACCPHELVRRGSRAGAVPRLSTVLAARRRRGRPDRRRLPGAPGDGLRHHRRVCSPW